MRKKRNLIVLVVFLVLILVVGGIWMHNKKSEEEAYWNTQKERITLFLKYNYEGVDKITFEDTYKLPTGTVGIDGYINGDKELDFSADMDSGMDFEAGGSTSAKLAEMSKKEYRVKKKTVSDILKDKDQ